MINKHQDSKKTNEAILQNDVINSVRNISPPSPEEEYDVRDAIQKNILLLGKSGQGKTTLFEMLKNPNYIPPITGLFAETQHPVYHPLVVTNKKDPKKTMSYNFIDTPGLFEVQKESDKKRTNEQLLNLASTCITKSVTKLSAVLLVYKFGSRLTEEDFQLIELLKKFIGGWLRKNIILVFTHAEDFDKEQIEEQVKKFFAGDTLSTFRQFVSGFAFTGALDPVRSNRYKAAYSEIAIPQITAYRQALLDRLSQMDDVQIPKAMIDSMMEPLKVRMSAPATERQSVSRSGVSDSNDDGFCTIL